MAGAWQIEQAPIAQLFTQGLLAGMARADQRRQEDNANALAMEETKARDSQVRAAMEHQRLEREAARQQTEQQRAAERAQRTQQIRYNMAKAVAARPELLPQFDAAIRRMSSGANAQIDPFELGGVHVNDGQGQFTHQAPSKEEAEGIAMEAQAMGAQPERDNSMTRDMLNFAERQRNPDFAAYQDSRTPKPKTQPSTKAPKEPKGGSGGDGGGKLLPPSAIAELSDYSAAERAVIESYNEYEKMLKSSGVVGQTRDRIAGGVPNTEASRYRVIQETAGQGYGLIAEGGKLSEADRPIYWDKMPALGDDLETAKRKRDAALRSLREKRAGRIRDYSSAGYRVPSATEPRAPAQSAPPLEPIPQARRAQYDAELE